VKRTCLWWENGWTFGITERTETIRVERLDDVLWRLQVDTVDFIKLDAEGAELVSCKGRTNCCAVLRCR